VDDPSPPAPSGDEPARRAGVRRRTYLIAAGVIAVLAVVSTVVAVQLNPSSISGRVDTAHLSDLGAAPPLRAEGWINSRPLGPEALAGKVVLYDFWTYSCINCVRTFPYLRSWQDRYRRDGLVVVGVHSPEFEFEKVHRNVARAVREKDVTWPVALDDGMAIWRSFENRYWPADYVADRSGHLRYTHFGEGDYTNTENVLRRLLGVAKSAPRAQRQGKAETASPQRINPETYLDVRHRQVQIAPGPHTYPAVGNLEAPFAALVGSWVGFNDKVTANAAGSAIRLGVHARSVNLVLGTATGQPLTAVVTLDGQPVPEQARGASLRVDAGTRSTVVDVSAPDMYRLVLAPAVQDHQLAVTADQPGLEAYAFTFG
jgi:thiol-disulfide isomerase/thioredoxin